MAGQDDTNARIFEKLDALSEVLHEMRIEVVELRTEIRLRKECPSPGLCVELKDMIDEHEKEIQRARGGWKVLTIVAATAGAVASSLIGWLQKH